MEFKRAFPEVQFRYFLFPSETLHGGLNLLNFDNSTNTWNEQMVGRLDAMEAVQAGPLWASRLLDSFFESPALVERWKDPLKYLSFKRRQRAQCEPAPIIF